MKDTLIKKILTAAVNKGYEYSLICPYDGTVELKRTNNISLGYGRKGVDNYDEIIIEFWQGENHKGNILWNNYNQGIEQVQDYHCKLDDKDNLRLDTILN
tara:strand:- start:514 stop:813 length:300 start_codon:yes stop_codon:yes gene_type:complete